jgi:N-acetylneuraminic acid mutarotase
MVLVAGGKHNLYYHNSAELYNPSTGAWTITESMNTARMWHMVSVLSNGQVLVTGGQNETVLPFTELYAEY